jgi:PST family polysaccharide transporter
VLILLPSQQVEKAMHLLQQETDDEIEITSEAREVAATIAPVPIPAPMSGSAPQKSYGQILKSSVMVGGSSLVNVAIGMVRTKVMALLLGPAGFGLFGVYNSIATLGQNLAGMGVNSSGVRQIAEAAGSGDQRRIAETSQVLRRLSFVLGLLGALLMVVLARPVALLTFGNSGHTAAIAGLGGVVLLMSISAGQSARIQGMRRIVELAKVSIASALGGTLLSIPLVYFLRERGIIPALIAVAATALAASWWYSRQIPVNSITVSRGEMRLESAALLKLGFAFMSSGLMTMGVAYVVRITVLRKVGMEATGLYQSAWTLGGLYVAFILQAMAADFYPRLTVCIRDHEVANRLVNEQMEIGLLLAGPGVLATLTFAPLAIALFYSSRFLPAVEILRWICLGTLLQVVSWPMGYIIVAKAKQALFFWCEAAWAVVSLALAWICVSSFGLKGAGIAFFGSYIFHGAFIYGVIRRLSGFRWSRENTKRCSIFFAATAVVFAGPYLLSFKQAVALGSVATLGSAAYSLHVLLHLVPREHLPPMLRRLLPAVPPEESR